MQTAPEPRATLLPQVVFHVEAGVDWVLFAQSFKRPWLTSLFNFLSHSVSVGFYVRPPARPPALPAVRRLQRTRACMHALIRLHPQRADAPPPVAPLPAGLLPAHRYVGGPPAAHVAPGAAGAWSGLQVLL